MLRAKLSEIKDDKTNLYDHISNVLTKILLDNPKVLSYYFLRMHFNYLKITHCKSNNLITHSKIMINLTMLRGNVPNRMTN